MFPLMAIPSKLKLVLTWLKQLALPFRHSLTGFEFACGIPGSVGGAVFMNAGAYGGEIAHILQSCKILTKDGEIETLSVKDLAFGYRHSAIQESGAVVLSAKICPSSRKPSGYQARKLDRLTHLRETQVNL